MPAWNIPVPEYTQSIVRPFIVQMVQKIQRNLKLPPETRIFYPGESNKMQTNGGNVNNVQNSKDPITDINKISFIEVEDLNPLETYAGPVTHAREYPPIFLDQAIGVVVSPVYFTKMFNFTITHRFISETVAQRWYNDLIVSITELKDIHLYTAQFHFAVNDEIYQLLKLIHSLKENVLPYGELFQTYMSRISNDRVTIVSNNTGDLGTLAVKESQFRIMGSYLFNGLPEAPKRNDSNGCWEAVINYRAQFECPIHFNVRYPVVVHNQPMPAEWVDFRGTNPEPLPEEVNVEASVTLGAMSIMEDTALLDRAMHIDPILRTPGYDDFIPKGFPGVGYFLTALAVVDETDKKTLFNLKELGEVRMDDDILQFIVESEYPYIGLRNQSIIQAFLFRNNSLVEDGSVLCNNKGDITLRTAANLRNQHRVVFGLYTDLTLLDNNALARLRRYPKAFAKIIATINELFRDHPDLVKIANQRVITELDFNPIYRFLTGKAPYGRNSNTSAGANGISSDGLRNLPYLPLSFKDIPKSAFDYSRSQIARAVFVSRSDLIVFRA